MFWLLILLAELISFKFLYVFLNFGFQAPILLTPALPLILAFNLGSHFQFCTKHFYSLCHTETELLDQNLTIPNPQTYVLFGVLLHFWSTEMFIWFLNWALSFGFLALYFVSHCYVLWIYGTILIRSLWYPNVIARNEMKKVY